jgi:hypothetical protein
MSNLNPPNEKEVTIRYSIEVPVSVDEVISSHTVWGIKAKAILAIINVLAKQLEEDGPDLIGFLLKERIKIVPITEVKP